MSVEVVAANEKAINAINKADQFFNKISENAQDVHPTEDQIFIDTSYSQYVPVRVVSGNGVTGYICDIFENGLAEPATKQGRVFLANGNSTLYVLPVGTVMYAQAINVAKLGTNN